MTTPETLNRADAHRKLLALGMPLDVVTHVLDHPDELLHLFSPMPTVVPSKEAVAIVEAYQRHCAARTDPLSTVPPEERKRIRNLAREERRAAPWAGKLVEEKAIAREVADYHERITIPRAILERLAKAAESDPGAREARWAAERILQQATLAAEPARTDPLHARVLAEATQIDARLTEPAPDSIGPRGSSYDGAHAPAPVEATKVVVRPTEQTIPGLVCTTCDVVVDGKLVASGKVRLNADGTIREDEARRIDGSLRASGVSAVIDRTHNVMLDQMLWLTPIPTADGSPQRVLCPTCERWHFSTDCCQA